MKYLTFNRFNNHHFGAVTALLKPNKTEKPITN